VLHCRYVESGVHEVALRFDTTIDPADHCPEALTVRILLATEDSSVVRQANVLLAELDSVVDVAKSGPAAVQKAGADCYDVIMVDMELPDSQGFDAVRELRARGYRGAVVATAAKQTPIERELCLNAGCDACLAKPLEHEPLEALLEWLREKPLAHPSDQSGSLGQARTGFAAALPARICALEKAAQAESWEEVVPLARDIRGEAGGHGWDALAEAAARVETAADAEQLGPDVKDCVAELVQLCLRVRFALRRVS